MHFKLSVLCQMWRDQLSYRQVATPFNLRNDAVTRVSFARRFDISFDWHATPGDFRQVAVRRR
ncbi:hypothetical protein [Burkholderia ambifaria]|uniref:hypothetical protein n=1 Tax=Burkholderia ambifaria TaxID=152480 RepID=UPI00315DA28E